MRFPGWRTTIKALGQKGFTYWATLGLLLVSLDTGFVLGATKEETFADGSRGVYTVDSAGTRNGTFREYWPNGKLKTSGSYREGHLHGSVKRFRADGTLHIRADYAEGKLDGSFVENDEQGKVWRTATLQAGKLHGPLEQIDDKKLVRSEFWLDGELLIPKSADLIVATYKQIDAMKIKTVGELPPVSKAVLAAVRDPTLQAKREAAVRRLMKFRYLCDVPYEDVALDLNYVAYAEAASLLMTAAGQLSHTPDNPGWPADEFAFARRGCESSNIASGSSLVSSVETYMADSDGKNMEHVGHRRRCLNPSMQKTGFGGAGRVSAMWSFDTSRSQVPDFDFMAFPPRGMVPTSAFSASDYWSVALNPKKYAAPSKDDVKVRIVPARLVVKPAALHCSEDSLELDYFHLDVARPNFDDCIIFRPGNLAADPGAAYWVEITGLVDSSGNPATLGYLTAFFQK